MTLHSVPPFTGRPIDALLAGFAAGTLGRPLHALVGAHLELKPDSRSFVGALEAAIGNEMVDAVPVPLAARDAMLQTILAAGQTTHADTAAKRSSLGSVPAALRPLLPSGLDDLKWRSRMPGIRECALDTADGLETTLYRVRAGRAMPSHTHDGLEITLVLQGGFSDVTGHYGRGDLAVADPDLDHKPVTDAHEDCICIAVTDAPLRLTGPVARLVRRLLGH